MSEYRNNMDSGRELGWDATIERDQSDFVLLPEGDYPFTVTGFERGRHNGSKKLPACNKAILTIEINGGTLGITSIKHNLFLHSKCEGLLSAFFISIGLKKQGEALNMGAYWGQLIGKTGICKVGVREWTSDRTGDKMHSNDITRFLEPAVPAQAEGWKPGVF